MSLIKKEDIKGSRIIKVHSTYEIMDSLDCTTIYFTTDKGMTFTMPFPGYHWESEEVPTNATELHDEIDEKCYLVKKHWLFGRRFIEQPSKKIDLIKRMKERLIVGVYCPKMDDELGFYPPDQVFFLFNDNSRAYCTSVAPHGTGASGLHYITDDDALTGQDELVDFFSIPLEDDD